MKCVNISLWDILGCFLIDYVPKTRRVGGYIVVGADPVGVGIGARFISSVHYLLNQLMDIDQICIDTLLGKEKYLIRF